MSERERFGEITHVFVGYLLKRTALRPDFVKNENVVEIASVSGCISAKPKDWITRWRHNELGFYNSEALAKSVLGEDERENEPAFDLYAYALYQICADAGKVEFLNLTTDAEELPSNYEFLGYDVISKAYSDFFECSPLSCNNLAAEVPVNRYCLIDQEADAFRLLTDMGAKYKGVEAGPYYLFRVYRRKR